MTASFMSLFMHSAFLAMEAQEVIGLRMLRIAAGGKAADHEMERMVSEKMQAAAQIGAAAAISAVTGKSAHAIASSAVSGYRKKVRANHRRLSR